MSYLRVERSDTPFTRGYNAGQVIRVPVAHGEGNYVADQATIDRLEGEGRVLFRYTAPDGSLDPAWNVNGATNAIAGILNDQGNVLGMMPHPENHVEAALGPTDGRGLFAGLSDHFACAAMDLIVSCRAKAGSGISGHGQDRRNARESRQGPPDAQERGRPARSRRRISARAKGGSPGAIAKVEKSLPRRCPGSARRWSPRTA